MFHFLRRLLLGGAPLSREAVRQVIEDESKRRSWPIEEPVVISLGLFTASGLTNADQLGGNSFFVISLRDGAVKKATFNSH